MARSSHLKGFFDVERCWDGSKVSLPGEINGYSGYIGSRLKIRMEMEVVRIRVKFIEDVVPSAL